ncbi:MAG: AMP-binding protein [Acidimicrobiales bacterium]|nr:AMP-binding protein [Acidimicrobiales bacterium]
MTASGFAYVPDPAAAAATNVGRFMAAHGFSELADLRRRSLEDPAWFWDAVVRFLDLPFRRPYRQVLDASAGFPWSRWFVGGELNLAEVCLDRHAAAHPSESAVVWEGEDGEVRAWSWAELRAEADGLAFLLTERGVGQGDVVGLFLPMVPEAVAAMLAIAKVGAMALPLFSGYGAEAVATRLADAGATALVTADGFYRRGRVVPMLEVAGQAAALTPSVATVVVVPRLGQAVPEAGPPVGEARLIGWPGPAGQPYPTGSLDAEHPFLLVYTSGTTGRPKASVHVHGGFVVKVAEEAAFQFDCRFSDTLFWFTDLGWIMGPWEIVGALSRGATLGLYEGAPDYPGPDRLWAYCERHRVSILGISPTLVRSLMPHGTGPVRAHDLSLLRILGSTGEPWNEGPWRWYFEEVGHGRCPVINISGGTEVGATFLSPHPVEAIKPVSLGGPSLGVAADVFDEEGKPVRESVGELVCTAPWPGMTRGLYRDPGRYLATYWSRWPDVWVHGDWASIDADGCWFLHGRSDDTIKVAGKRLGPAEVESALVAHGKVIEAVAVGVPDDRKGEALWAYVVLAPGDDGDEALRDELSEVVGARLGRPFRPDVVRFADALPKTRNAKVLRRAVRAAATGEDPGDLSALEDPGAIEAIRAAR